MSAIFLLALVVAAQFALSVLAFAGLARVTPRVAAAVIAPLLTMLAGFAFVAVESRRIRPDAEAIHLLMLSPPFAFAITFPILALLLLWVLATRRRG
jgi:hypothetical protein